MTVTGVQTCALPIFNFWFGLGLLQLVLALSLTGYLLPWDQKGYWATKVATNIMGIVPVFGPALQRLVIGEPHFSRPPLSPVFRLPPRGLPRCVPRLHVSFIFTLYLSILPVQVPKQKPSPQISIE